jgi:hypothetical protein
MTSLWTRLFVGSAMAALLGTAIMAIVFVVIAKKRKQAWRASRKQIIAGDKTPTATETASIPGRPARHFTAPNYRLILEQGWGYLKTTTYVALVAIVILVVVLVVREQILIHEGRNPSNAQRQSQGNGLPRPIPGTALRNDWSPQVRVPKGRIATWTSNDGVSKMEVLVNDKVKYVYDPAVDRNISVEFGIDVQTLAFRALGDAPVPYTVSFK